ncbi:MAG: zinc ABC transporter ATP-binding protein ZnuC [Geminicoccaceae bacterium]
MPTLVEAQGITLRIGRSELLCAVDLEVRPHEVVSLIGPNGAGKTTLIRVLLGLLTPSAGRVWRRPRLVIGYVPQRMRIDPVLPLTVRRFLTIGSRRVEIASVLAAVGARHLARASMHELSGGELQRVVLARALVRDPALLILDEPAQGVDFNGQLELYRLIERIRDQRGCGVLLVSHDLHVVMGATDRVVCLNRHVCCSGAPETVSRHPEYLGLFGPRAAASLAIYAHDHDHAHDLAGEVVALPEDDARATPHDRARTGTDAR